MPLWFYHLFCTHRVKWFGWMYLSLYFCLGLFYFFSHPTPSVSLVRFGPLWHGCETVILIIGFTDKRRRQKNSHEADSRARRVSQWIPKIPLRIWSALRWCRESRRFNYCGTLQVLDPLPTSYRSQPKLAPNFSGRVLWVNLRVNEHDGLFQKGRLGWPRLPGLARNVQPGTATRYRFPDTLRLTAKHSAP